MFNFELMTGSDQVSTETPINYHQLCNTALSFDEYMFMMDELVEQGRTTGFDPPESYIAYTALNRRRMMRWMKTISLSDKMLNALDNLETNLCFLVITESWCSDAAHSIPLFGKLAETSDKITVKIILRDEHPDVIDQFRTKGARSIPIVLALNADKKNHLVFKWGPYTEPIVKIKEELATTTEPAQKESIQLKLQEWYNKDRSETLQLELIEKFNQYLI